MTWVIYSWVNYEWNILDTELCVVSFSSEAHSTTTEALVKSCNVYLGEDVSCLYVSPVVRKHSSSTSLLSASYYRTSLELEFYLILHWNPVVLLKALYTDRH